MLSCYNEMRSSRMVRSSGCQCLRRNSPEFDPSILRHSGILRAADEAVLNNVHKRKKKRCYNELKTLVYQKLALKKQNSHRNFLSLPIAVEISCHILVIRIWILEYLVKAFSDPMLNNIYSCEGRIGPQGNIG
jgi:hypothetical protein